ncbi:MAG: NUDIX hydrolase [Bacteroidales bacterium]|nr:NUDIX hydrolase [Bacteroidales bacterium]
MKPNYGYKYPRPAVATDSVIFGYDVKEKILKILLIERGIEPFQGKMSLPGGFIKIKTETDEDGFVINEENESLLDCARRELEEETGCKVRYMTELGAFSTPGRDPRGVVISDAYYALVIPGPVRGGDDAMEAQWLPFHEVLDVINHMPKGFHFLAFDHDDIVKKAYYRLKEDICFEPIAFRLLPEKFSMTQVQNIYQEVLGKEFDRRNFSRKVLDSGVLDMLPHTGRNIYYRLNEEKYESMRNSGKRLKLIFV